MTKKNYVPKIPFTVQLLKEKKNSHLATAIFRPLNSSISSKYHIAVSDFGTKEKKKSLEMLHFQFNFPHPAKTKVKFPTPRAQKVVKCLRFARGGGGGRRDVEVSINLSFSIFTSTALIPVHLQRALSTIKDARKKQ